MFDFMAEVQEKQRKWQKNRSKCKKNSCRIKIYPYICRWLSGLCACVFVMAAGHIDESVMLLSLQRNLENSFSTGETASLHSCIC